MLTAPAGPGATLWEPRGNYSLQGGIKNCSQMFLQLKGFQHNLDQKSQSDDTRRLCLMWLILNDLFSCQYYKFKDFRKQYFSGKDQNIWHTKNQLQLSVSLPFEQNGNLTAISSICVALHIVVPHRGRLLCYSVQLLVTVLRASPALAVQPSQPSVRSVLLRVS